MHRCWRCAPPSACMRSRFLRLPGNRAGVLYSIYERKGQDMAVKTLYIPVSWSHDPMQLKLLKELGQLDDYYKQQEAEANEAMAVLDHHVKDGWQIISEHKLDLSKGCKIAFVLFHPAPPEGTAIKKKGEARDHA